MPEPYPNVAIVGAYNTRQARRLEGATTLSVCLDAARGVIAEVGVETDAVDGIFGNDFGDLVYALGLPAASTTNLESVGIPSVIEAASAIQAGLCETALVVSGQAGMYVDRSQTAPWTFPESEWLSTFGLYTAVEFALMARRHMHAYGTEELQLATVAASIRNNGSINPEAVYFGRGPFSPEDVLSSPVIADPFHLLDCSMTSEGGAALLLTTRERAKDLRLLGVKIMGVGTDRVGPWYKQAPRWDLSAARVNAQPAGLVGHRAARIAFGMGGLAPADVDVCEFYDPFSFEIIRQFEAFGFCEVGEGGDFVMGGRIAPDGEFPTTTDGGLLSYSHASYPQLLQRVGRGVHQLQGVCPTNQISGAEVVMCSNGGSGAMFTDVILLGRV